MNKTVVAVVAILAYVALAVAYFILGREPVCDGECRQQRNVQSRSDNGRDYLYQRNERNAVITTDTCAAAGHNPLLHRRARRVQRVLGVNPLEGTKMTLQERAYTSPIWFTPEM